MMKTSILLCFIAALVVLSGKCNSKILHGKGKDVELSRSPRSAKDLIITIPLHDDLKQTFVDAHNRYRSHVKPPASNMKKLSWSDQLEELGKHYSGACTFAHSSKKSRKTKDYHDLGENIARGLYFVSEVGVKATTAWHDEVAFYNHNTSQCDPGKVCGHFTAVVRAETELVGCGVSFCNNMLQSSNGHIVVCYYYPAGTTHTLTAYGAKVGVAPYKTGLPCSECDLEFSSCENKLCVAPQLSKNSTTTPPSLETTAEVISHTLVTTPNPTTPNSTTPNPTTPNPTTSNPTTPNPTTPNPTTPSSSTRNFSTTPTPITETTKQIVQQHEVKRCWNCNAGSEDECKEYGRLEMCDSSNDICESETRFQRDKLIYVSKGCKQKEACLNDQHQNWKGQCNAKALDSVCRCCCSKQDCNLGVKCNPKTVEATKSKLIALLFEIALSAHIMFHVANFHSQLEKNSTD